MSGIVLLLIILSGFCDISLAVVSSVYDKRVQRSIYADQSMQAPVGRFFKDEKKVQQVLLFLKYGLLTFTLLCCAALVYLYAIGVN